MVKTLLPHQLTVIHHLLFERQLKPDDIAKRQQVSQRTVYNLEKNWKLFGQPYPPSLSPIGRPRTLTEAQELAVLDFLTAEPTSLFEEVAWFLFDDYGVIVPDYTLSKLLKRRKWSQKVARKVATQRNAALRAEWQARRLYWSVDDLIFVDESIANERTSDRKRG